MNRVKWIDKKFTYSLNQNKYKDILSKLNETPCRIAKLVNHISSELLAKKNDEKWSVKENIGHLIDLEELHSGRIDDFITGKKTLRPADLTNKKTYDAGYNRKDINYLITELKRARQHFVKRLSELDKATLNKSSIHPRLNRPMRPIDMAQFVLEHDEHHIETINEIIEKFII